MADSTARTLGIVVSIRDGANDGERDNVWADVERVRGGSGDDVLTGDGRQDALTVTFDLRDVIAASCKSRVR
ncbi:MAG TPA: hypothetical protein VGJ32_08805 [Solirubrobacteraceae bacterium]|jgi:hypothetical protein